MTGIGPDAPRGADDLATQIAVLRAQLASLDRLWEERDQISRRALDIATSETHRRLDMLNGEQARLASDRERFITREVFEQFRQEYRTAHEALSTLVMSSEQRAREALENYRTVVDAQNRIVSEELAVYRGRERGMGTIIGGGIAVITILLSVATFIILYAN